MDVDYLIIGQGISGTLLSYYLWKAGKTVMVVDDAQTSSSSRVAGGIVNPVTGKRMVRSWMIDELLPAARNTYLELGRELHTTLLQEWSILEFHATQEISTLFADKLPEEEMYLHHVPDSAVWAEYFRFNYGVGEIAPCLLLDIRAMLAGWRARLKEMDALREEQFRWEDCEVAEDGVVYKGDKSHAVICCEGSAGADSPYFSRLPWSKDKGEALIVSIPGLPRNHIYKQGIAIVPWVNDLFWIGATHDWNFTDMDISEAFRKKLSEQLDYWLKLPYKIVDHLVAQRPANVERKPFVGLHPVHCPVGILNGMGGKGVSMAPYFAQQLVQYLVTGTPLKADVDVRRFSRTLSRGGEK
jgi:glycine/D-amino acid oxidase-like deaminating enzyme